ncbi:uncharacterized protein A1O5_04731 [Cladophialophora psammophila CBS 110553]|uniref:Dystroglycan-type cadherin-like domain-containing protein n=1 Tax=Cladophialophora psammophila CBS 110553 TaxID=1182543 RepID=W9WVK0_9EURO|nr:uncharacterized protein A1O5_04731 [Cladophialophora psammophila CBS 110553]EXJ72227.1 hypothetical protein A1O5_04731 [Cladophialophora psammophila CBS 110553]
MYLTAISRPLLACSLAVALDLVAAIPELAFPLNSQIPPVAYVAQPYSFAFSANTFTSRAPQISYTFTQGPKWLDLDSASRQFSGVPTGSDLGTTTLQLVASDSTGQSSTSVTFIVLESPTLKLNAPLLPQLEKSGIVSPPNSLLVHPQQPFHLAFEKDTFSGATFGTRYYAVSVDSSPLPPWVEFDESQLAFSGTTPALVSSLAGPETYGLRLVASNVPGFAELSIGFQIVISRRLLAFSTAFQHIRISTGVRFESVPLRPLITLDGDPVRDDQIVSIDANVPAWVELDRKQVSLRGIPDASVSATITISVTDIYDNVANATIFLESTGASSVSLGTIGVVNLTAGEYFSYTLIAPTFSPSIHDMPVLGNASVWLDFDAQTWTLSGLVPSDLSPQTLNITITFVNTTTNATGDVILHVLQKAFVTATTPTHTTQTSNVPGASDTSKGSEAAMRSLNGNAANRRVLHIVLAVVFSLVGALLAALVILCWLRRRRKKNETGETSFEGRPALVNGHSHEPPNQLPLAMATSNHLASAQGTAAPGPLRMVHAWSNDSLQNSRQRLSGTGRLDPLSQHRTSQVLPPNRVPVAHPEAAEEFDRAVDSAFEASPVNARLSPPRLPAIPSRFSATDLESQQRNSPNSPRLNVVSCVVGLPDRSSGAGHGAGILIPPDIDQTSWRNTWASNFLSERRRTTLVLDSFPAPPVEGSASARTGSKSKKSVPVLRIVPEDSSQPLSFEELRQKWHTERARAKLEGSARFSNAGSARMMASPRTMLCSRNAAASANQDPPTSTSRAKESKIVDIQASREHSRSRWSGVGLGAPGTARGGSLLHSYTGHSPTLRTKPSIASSGQFESVASSDGHLEDENTPVEETAAEPRQWQADNNSQSSPRIPFNILSHSRENVRNNDSDADARHRASLADGRKHISVEEGGLKRTQGSRRGSFRFI